LGMFIIILYHPVYIQSQVVVFIPVGFHACQYQNPLMISLCFSAFQSTVIGYYNKIELFPVCFPGNPLDTSFSVREAAMYVNIADVFEQCSTPFLQNT